MVVAEPRKIYFRIFAGGYISRKYFVGIKDGLNELVVRERMSCHVVFLVNR